MQDTKHLFILGHPASGSTLLMKLLSTSEMVSAFATEGQHLQEAKNILFVQSRWDASYSFDWERVKKIWAKHWDDTKPVLLEKSPPNLLRIDALDKHFENAHFIILLRNPYAYIEGSIRRRNRHVPIHIMAKRWLYFASFQKKNLKSKYKTLSLSYEELTNNPQEAIKKIQVFLPEVGTIDFNKEFDVFGNKSKIRNKNSEQIASLKSHQIKRINDTLKDHLDLLNYFNYDLLANLDQGVKVKDFLKSFVRRIKFFLGINKRDKGIDAYIKKWEKDNFFPF